MSEYKEALEHMVWQFAYRSIDKDNKSILWTGGLSALEGAFNALGWLDPHIVEDFDGGICDVKDCSEWVETQGGVWADTGYWCLCRIHSDAYRQGKPQPKMKQRAIDRELSRNPETGCLPMK